MIKYNGCDDHMLPYEDTCHILLLFKPLPPPPSPPKNYVCTLK